MPDVALEAPRSVGDLYLTRGNEVAVARPITTGDIFTDIAIPGVEELEGDDEQLALVVTHPCSMRQGYRMKPRLQVIRVIRAPVVDFKAWKQYFDRMPLPNLFRRSEDDDIIDPEDSYAAMFELRGRIATDTLLLDKRQACMTELGVGLLHQRMGHADNRFAPRVSDLVAACASPFAETELAEEWNAAFVSLDGVSPSERTDLLLASAEEFEGILSELRESPQATSRKTGKHSLRDDLGDPTRAAGARREVMKMIRERRSTR